jgi:hypothetical protein
MTVWGDIGRRYPRPASRAADDRSGAELLQLSCGGESVVADALIAAQQPEASQVGAADGEWRLAYLAALRQHLIRVE